AGTPGGELPASEKEVIRPPDEDEKPDVAVPGGTVECENLEFVPDERCETGNSVVEAVTTMEGELTDESSVNSVGSVNKESSLSNGPVEGKEYTTNMAEADTGETTMNIRGETEKAQRRLVATVVYLGSLSKTTAGTDDAPKNMTTHEVSAMTGKNDVVRQYQMQRDRGDDE
ncbi:hypothetical protein JG688_00012092, partial [Phytophthora aleatoria]